MNRSSLPIALLSLSTSLVCGDLFAAPTEIQRYPFDPACAWGRLADGRGLIVRCLTREESERLSKPAMPAPGPQPGVGSSATAGAQGAQKSDAPGPGPVAVAATSAGTPAAGPPSNTAATAPAAASPTAPSEGPSSVGTQKEPLLAEMVSVTADEGELPLAKRKLAVPVDRYAKCVNDHAGLTAATGQVQVRFLVRERGRAEGATVEKFQGMTEAAASCIAQVVDRRPTGAPEVPVVGATALIRVRRRPPK